MPIAGTSVVGALHRPAAGGRGPCVIACHGMGASKESDKYLMLARELPAAGLALARFDFRGSGESGGSYRDATVATRIADLEAVLDHLARHPGLDGRVALLGSSLGGFIALWVAVRRRPLGVVTWNAPAGLADLAHAAECEAMGLGPALIHEVREGRFADAPAGARGVLVVQGGADDVVPPAHAKLLFERARDPREIHLLAGADHRFSDPAHRLEALDVSRRWLAERLLGAPE